MDMTLRLKFCKEQATWAGVPGGRADATLEIEKEMPRSILRVLPARRRGKTHDQQRP